MRPHLLPFAAVLLAACGDTINLPDAQIPNVVDTVSLSALTGTPITLPSAFSVSTGQPVRTDLSAEFDFAFDIREGQPVLLPRAALNFPPDGRLPPGLQRVDDAFEAILEAPSNGYLTRDTLAVAVGERYVARSRVVCTSLGVPLYGKLEVLAIDAAARTLTFEVLVDENCGYIGLAPGVPEE